MSFKVRTPYNKDEERREEGCSDLPEPQKKKKTQRGHVRVEKAVLRIINLNLEDRKRTK